jgi:hypothetical protein
VSIVSDVFFEPVLSAMTACVRRPTVCTSGCAPRPIRRQLEQTPQGRPSPDARSGSRAPGQKPGPASAYRPPRAPRARRRGTPDSPGWRAGATPRPRGDPRWANAGCDGLFPDRVHFRRLGADRAPRRDGLGRLRLIALGEQGDDCLPGRRDQRRVRRQRPHVRLQAVTVHHGEVGLLDVQRDLRVDEGDHRVRLDLVAVLGEQGVEGLHVRLGVVGRVAQLGASEAEQAAKAVRARLQRPSL